jgi:hypothetical protein
MKIASLHSLFCLSGCSGLVCGSCEGDLHTPTVGHLPHPLSWKLLASWMKIVAPWHGLWGSLPPVVGGQVCMALPGRVSPGCFRPA